MPVAESGEFVTEAYEMAVSYLTRVLGAERALIVQEDGPKLRVRGGLGFDLSNVLESGNLSLGVIKDVLSLDTAQVRSDIQSQPQTEDQVSLQISGIQSYLCVPYRDPKGRRGVLYADILDDKTAFSTKHSTRAIRFARHLEQDLEKAKRGFRVQAYREPLDLKFLSKVQWPTAEVKAPPSKPKKSTKPKKPDSQPQLSDPAGARLTALDRISFFRVLYLMLEAGLPLTKCTELISIQGETPELRTTAAWISQAIVKGHRISQAVRNLPNCFNPLHADMIRVGEETGCLPMTLRSLAEQEKRTYELGLKIQSVMVYPLIVLLLCGVLLILAPSFLLKGQLQLLAQTGGDVPLLTSLLITLSNFVTSGPGVATLLVSAAVCVMAFRAFLSKPERRLQLVGVLSHTPVVGRALQDVALTRFARTLALCLKVGMRFTQALPLAASVTANPHFQETIPDVVHGLKAGLSLGEALETQDLFPPTFVEFIKVGEETGTLSDMAGRMAHLCESRLEAALDAYTAMLEPLVLLIVGGATGLMMLATMSPMVKALQLL